MDMDNLWQIGGLVVAGVVAAAPIITKGVDRFGSPKVKRGWSFVRRVYNRVYAKQIREQGNGSSDS